MEKRKDKLDLLIRFISRQNEHIKKTNSIISRFTSMEKRKDKFGILIRFVSRQNEHIKRINKKHHFKVYINGKKKR